MGLFNRKRSKAATAAQGHRIIIAPAGDDWVIQLTGAFDNKTSAMLVGRAIAAFLDLQLDWRGTDGRIQGADSAGNANDPRDIPG